MSFTDIDRVKRLESVTLQMSQIDVKIEQEIHAGSYIRTATIPKGVMITGALIKIDTILVVFGHVTVYIGKEFRTLSGYNVLKANANRKQVFIAHEETKLSMIFATNAQTVEEAEAEFTEEVEKLTTRKTEGLLCQV
jgi:hypothetical protein